MQGSTIGVIANQPMVLAGCLDIDSSKKAARFVRFCDCFNIPILTLVDVPGFLPGTQQEYGALSNMVPSYSLLTRRQQFQKLQLLREKHMAGPTM